MYNGWTPTIQLKTRLTNLLNCVPQEYQNRAIAECTRDNPYDTERYLTSYVMGRIWETYPHPVNEMQDIEREIDKTDGNKIADKIDDMLSGNPERILKHITQEMLHPKPYSSFKRFYAEPLSAEELENMAGGDL